MPYTDVIAGRLKGAEWLAGDGRAFELSARYRHRIPVERMTYEAIGAADGNGTISLEKAAWSTVLLDPRTNRPKTMIVRLKDDERKQAETLVRRGLALPKLESALTDAASVDKIAAFVGEQLAKHADPSHPLVRTPGVFIELCAKRDSQGAEPASVVNVLARGRNMGLDKRGEPIVDAVAYDELLYCPQKARLESREAHNVHLRKAVGK